MSNIPTTEPIPQYYHTDFERPEAVGVQPDVHLLTKLREELNFGPGDEKVISSAYSVARTIGDIELFQADDEGLVSSLLDHTRSYARPSTFDAKVNSDPAKDDVIGSFSAGKLRVGFEKVVGLGRDLKAYMAEANHPLLNEGDGILFAALHVGAHESGHAILSGIGEFAIQGDLTQYMRHQATTMYLVSHPELGFTGNLKNDAAIQEERFAEGLATIVTRKAMQTLGYDEDAIKTLLSVVSPASVMDLNADNHQIDFLNKTGAEKSLVDLVVEADVEVRNNSLGFLGYSSALSKAEVVSELKELTIKLQQKVKPVIPGGTVWEISVRNLQSPTIRNHIAQLKATRESLIKSTAIPEKQPKTRSFKKLGRPIVKLIRPKRQK